MKKSAILMASLLAMTLGASASTSGMVDDTSMLSLEPPRDLNKTWVLHEYRGDLLSCDLTAVDVQVPELELRLGEMAYYGQDGCALVSGELQELTDNVIRFGETRLDTKELCRRGDVPTEFHSALDEVRTYMVQDNMLHLFNEDGEKVLVFRMK